MPAFVNVFYPSGTKFDLDYYLTKHMPMVHKLWGSAGLTSYKVVKFPEGQPYSIQAVLEWADFSNFEAATKGEHIGEVIADVKNFSDKEPQFVPGNVVGSS